MAYRLGNGELVDGMFVCHTCDVPACVNPRHLYLGTAQTNMDDKVRRGRATRMRGRGKRQLALAGQPRML